MLRLVPALVLTLSLSALAAPLPLDEARRHLEKGAFDELYLSFAGLKPGAHPAGDRQVAALLVEASAGALEADDASLALGIADTARSLDPKSVAAHVAAADAALALEQRGAAAEALDAALAVAPSNWNVVFRRGLLAVRERELELARELFRRIPSSAPESANARRHLADVELELQRLDDEREELQRIEAEQRRRQADAARTAGGTPTGLPGRTATASPTSPASAPAGMAARESRHFRIVYSEGSRDFAQRAQYEQRVLDMFERAHEGVRRRMGRLPDALTDVVLYTREEFALHFGSQFGSSLLGFYSGRIRMNHADVLDDRFYATAVHEYVHAVVDRLTGGRIGELPTWLNEGLARWVERQVAGGDYMSLGERTELRAALANGSLPTLAHMADGPASAFGPRTGLVYSKGSVAVQALTRGGGLDRLVSVLEEVGRGASFDDAFSRTFGASRLTALDDEVAALVR